MIEKMEHPEYHENLSMIISSGKRLNSLVNDILDFSKLRQADLQLNPKPIDPSTIAGVVVQNLRPLAKGKELEIRNEIPSDLPAVLADENRLQQILFNLVGNAVKFTEKGFVAVSARQKEEFLEFQVADSGIGIPEEKLVKPEFWTLSRFVG